jgi:hypothetical protein
LAKYLPRTIGVKKRQVSWKNVVNAKYLPKTTGEKRDKFLGKAMEDKILTK